MARTPRTLGEIDDALADLERRFQRLSKKMTVTQSAGDTSGGRTEKKLIRGKVVTRAKGR